MSESTVIEYARDTVRETESRSRKYLRAEHSLKSAIAELDKLGFNTVELVANLEEVQEKRGLARVVRAEAKLWLARALHEEQSNV